ncbi:glycosyltransferase family 2 protein [Methylocystis heyeri]|uniref:Glycosyltransferase n=1 Tax=Methylocystis heyeri TaxID=391905 RepID=A0A6B8KJC4_9HYPH|nr:glycosyltransferase family 2 protein [Methylocystis heyeri]QGM47782.1 glycosyltransferase [Methylocystis heyeri]
MTTLSIVTPCYNEEGGIAECYDAVREVMASKLPDLDYEHIFIDNCSLDRTVEILRGIAARDKRVKIIVNARNFGAARSSHYGFLQGRGDAVVPVLADLQTPPALIPEMVELWRKGAKAVIAVRRGTPEKAFLRFTRSLFYFLMRKFSRIEQIPNFMGYGLYDRRVVDAMRELNEPEPYFRGLVMEVGFERAVVEYDQPPRRHGRSSYNFFSLADFALLGLSTYSRAPLRLMIFLGFSVSLLSFVAGVVYLFIKLLFWYSVPVGVAPVLISIFFLGSIQLFALGVLGEYIGLLLNYSRQFPLVIERERINFD